MMEYRIAKSYQTIFFSNIFDIRVFQSVERMDGRDFTRISGRV